MTRTRSAMLPVLVFGAVAIAAAAETLRIDSVWSPEAPTVDGKLTEWSSPLVTLGQTKLSLGVRNDGQHLYLALASSDQATRLMLGAAGFTVWIDPAGKEKKAFGITVPAAMKGPGMRGRGQGAPPEPGQEGREGGPGAQDGPAMAAITSIEVVGPSNDDRRRTATRTATTTTTTESTSAVRASSAPGSATDGPAMADEMASVYWRMLRAATPSSRPARTPSHTRT